MSTRTILGIESSCDDTAAAIISGTHLRSTVSAAQDVHAALGGVVPELASRDHQRRIVPIVQKALDEASCSLDEIDAVAATYGPGLSGSLLVGLSFGKALALGLGRPFIGVNHLEGHLYSVFIEPPHPPFPYLCLVVSGGHTQLTLVESVFEHRLLGRTRDDAAGEAFDKVARLLNLGYPGGPEIDRHAVGGDPSFHAFPRSRPGRYDFSFSGLKTSVLYYLNEFSEEGRELLIADRLPDLCASFQEAVVDVLTDAIRDAVRETGVGHVAITGGVSANSRLRARAGAAAADDGFQLYVPRLQFCMDNAAMIAVVGRLKLEDERVSPLTLTVDPQLSL